MHLVLRREVEAHLLDLEVPSELLLLDGVLGDHGTGHLNFLSSLNNNI